jgi:hypothetical protein
MAFSKNESSISSTDVERAQGNPHHVFETRHKDKRGGS